LVTFAHCDVEHQFRVPFDCYENIAISEVLIVLRSHALLFLADERPHFVRFHVAYFDVANLFGHDALALFAGEDQKLKNCGVMNPSNAFGRRNAVSFKQKLENHFSVANGRVHAVQRGVMRFGESLRALATAKALKPIAVLAKALAFGAAIVAGQSGLELSSGRMHNGRGTQKSLTLGFDLRLNPGG
jgi:hypothetical protein